ncbi:hypothetical protein AB0C96_31700, partial [Streptomyces sp. NPDC048506]
MTGEPWLEPGDLEEAGSGVRAERSDAELVERARAGDDVAFGVLYEHHFESARRLAGVFVSSAADAEDIAS